MTLYKIQYYEQRERSTWQTNRREMLVFAESEDEALEYVEETVEDFKGFPWDHHSARVVTEPEWHKA